MYSILFYFKMMKYNLESYNVEFFVCRSCRYILFGQFTNTLQSIALSRSERNNSFEK